MDIKKFKIGIGPISKEIIDLCLEYSSTFDYPIMLIASRNQVDYNSGYVSTTAEYIAQVKENKHYSPDRILLCRDHCGPYFSDLDINLELSASLDRCIKTIDADVSSGFDLIHIDVSRVPAHEQQNATTNLFTSAFSKNKNILFEFGSEDNTGNTNDTLISIIEQKKWIKDWDKNICYIAAQTGSLVKQTQIGNFNIEQNQIIANEIHNSGYFFKEHNADYLNRNQVKLRALAGVDALNVAPQLGSICSNVLYDLGKGTKEFENFSKIVLSSDYWSRWTTNESHSDTTKFIVSAHYLYGRSEYSELVNSIGVDRYKEVLRENLFKVLNEYKIGYEL